MEFPFAVNYLLRDEITAVDKNLQPCKRTEIDRHGFKQLQSMLYEIVDKMGDASAKAQGLHSSITSGRKLEIAGHRHYIMKDGNGNGGKGAVVGILKVGTKKLFVYDNSKNQHELDPLCILDFYVHESLQRMGCGRKLFDFMLKSEGILPQHLAIDRPSTKLSSFLKKHYRLYANIPQVNNFVIFEGFFSNRTDLGKRNGRRDSHGFQRPLSPAQFNSGPYGRTGSVPSASSPQGSRNQWSGMQRNIPQDSLNGANVQRSPEYQQHRDGSIGVGDTMYSCHRPSSTNSSRQRISATPPTNGMRNQRVQSPANQLYKNKLSSPHMYYNTEMNVTNYYPQGEPLPPQNLTQSRVSPQDHVQRNLWSTPNFGNKTEIHDTNGHASLPPVDLQVPEVATNHLPDIAGQHPNNDVLPGGTSIVSHRTPSGKRNASQKNDLSNPPILLRGAPPSDYTDLFNMHQAYQGRRGHLAMPDRCTKVSTLPEMSTQKVAPATLPLWEPVNRDASWTVTKVLREQRMDGGAPSRYNLSRLW